MVILLLRCRSTIDNVSNFLVLRRLEVVLHVTACFRPKWKICAQPSPRSKHKRTKAEFWHSMGRRCGWGLPILNIRVPMQDSLWFYILTAWRLVERRTSVKFISGGEEPHLLDSILCKCNESQQFITNFFYFKKKFRKHGKQVNFLRCN